MASIRRQDWNVPGIDRVSDTTRDGFRPGRSARSTRPQIAKSRRLAGADKNIQAIDDDYNRQLLQLDKRRLEQLGRLAARQKPAEAAATYERLFRLAIAGDLFRDAEAAAGKVLGRGPRRPRPTLWPIWSRSSPRPTVGPLNSPFKACVRPLPIAGKRRATEARAVLAPGEVIGICEAYYQRLVEGNQFPIAREAFQLVLEHSTVLASKTSSQAV